MARKGEVVDRLRNDEIRSVVAVDTSSLRRYLAGARGSDTELVRAAVEGERAALPPVVITEVLSEPTLDERLVRWLLAIDVLSIRDGYWERAGLLRARLLREDLKAAVADCLIAQSCIDHDVPLITYDRDFRHFQKAGLKLL